MSLNILVDISIALLSGFLGAFLQSEYIRPLSEYRTVKQRIAKDLVVYGYLISNPGSGSSDETTEARMTLREDAGDLRGAQSNIPDSMHRIFDFPSEDEFDTAKGRLIRLSNSLDQNGNPTQNNKDRTKIQDCLDI